MSVDETKPLVSSLRHQHHQCFHRSQQSSEQVKRVFSPKISILISVLLIVLYTTAFVLLGHVLRHRYFGVSQGDEAMSTASLLPSAEEILSASISPRYTKISKNDFGPYKEFSVIHSDRSLNMMSPPFHQVMQDLSTLLKATYQASKIAIIPGSGTFGMESVARQFATYQHVLVLRNGYFSYRWTQILDSGSIARSCTVLMAVPVPQRVASTIDTESHQRRYAPHPIDQVILTIRRERPAVVFAAHVESSTGIILPDEYIYKVASVTHGVDGIFVLDCIASGTVWVDMEEMGVDVIVAAPQKDWTSPPSTALIMLSERAASMMENDSKKLGKASSFSLSLPDWLRVMNAYEKGVYLYHSTLPSDALREFQRTSVDMLVYGLEKLKVAQIKLGEDIREEFNRRGLVSVAASGFESPGTLVYYNPEQRNVTHIVDMVDAFQKEGLQIANGVPSWMIDEQKNHSSFRIGLFGLDKLMEQKKTKNTLLLALDSVLETTNGSKV